MTLIFVLTLIFSFWYSLKYSGSKKNDTPELIFSNTLIVPDCSVKGGFYKEPITISLSVGIPNLKIYFTTDGSEPTLKSEIYARPIVIQDITANRNSLSAIPTSPRWKPPLGDVFKGTIIRAIAVDPQNHKSAELKRSFFVMSNKSKYTLPVISMIINQKDFFGYNKGIYVLGKTYLDKDNYIRKQLRLDLPWWEYPANYMLRGSDAERDAFIELYEPNGKLGFQSNVGIRINGNATRGFPQKSLRVCFRSKYGQPILDYNLFLSNPVKRFNSFVLRNSGNDGNKTMFRDAFMQSLMKNTHVDIQDNRQAVVFINGEYWGIHNIRERFDENYLVNKYHLPVDSLSILELNGTVVYGEKHSATHFEELIDFVKKNDLSKPKNYQFISDRIDVQSFQDFIISNVFFCNSDWPNNNVKFWRYTGGDDSDTISVRDGRWRWILFDTDWGFGYNESGQANANLLKRATHIGNVGVLFDGLLKNETFKAQFLQRFQELLNTTFESNHMLEVINEFETALKPEIQEHINRWRAIESLDQWKSNVAVMKDFAQKRPKFQAEQLNAFFELQGKQQITIKSSSKAH